MHHKIKPILNEQCGSRRRRLLQRNRRRRRIDAISVPGARAPL